MLKNSFWRLVLLSASIWTICWIGIKSAENNGFTMAILWTSILAGLGYGFFWALFMKMASSDPFKHVRLNLEEGERIIKEGGAYTMNGTKGEGGKLALTDRRLIYKGQRYDTQGFQWNLEFDQIADIRIHKSWMLLKNELHMDMADGTNHRFAMDKPAQWLSAIQGQMTARTTLHFEKA